MSTNFEEEVKDYLLESECFSCGGFLFVTTFKVVDNKTAEGTVRCPDCDFKMNSVFHRE